MLGNPTRMTCVLCNKLIGPSYSLHVVVSDQDDGETADVRYCGASAHAACIANGISSSDLRDQDQMKAMVILNRIITQE